MRHLSRDRRWFRLDAHDGPDPDPKPDPDPTPDPDPKPDPDPDPDPDPKTFTQEELEKIIGERIGRERAKYADYDELKAAAEKLAEIEDANKSELEKAQEAAAAAAAERDQERTAARELVLENDVLKLADDHEVADPVAAFKLLDRSQVTYGDDGKPSNVGELLDQLVTAHPVLKGEPKIAGDGDGGAKGGKGDPKDFRTADNDDFAAEARRYGLRPRST